MVIYTKLAKARRMLQESNLIKTGKGYKFTYYALEDFLPRTNEIFEELGLCSFTQIQPDEFTGAVVAKMIIADDDGGEITFAVPYAPAVLEGGAADNPVQCMGAAITYLTRYLWTQVMAISEFDQVDGAGQPVQKAQATSGNGRTITRPQPANTPKFETKPTVGTVNCLQCGNIRDVKQNPNGSMYVETCKSCKDKWSPYEQ